ncbi:hypothetical protein PPYR_05321 [Photinus pyralis]|uniref:Uncharacterized protein n=1 Tax=Photinus pyralis TaxID=7054 RepID=A0A1Y1M9U4_PHOPY|nr:uncharacterized protein LOC116165979 isoform X2 [Photinus pyralis]XP_031336632.1 uncharacterized protein LOC116165979 isoform X2 [Photinus pyralis]KAB0800967.1 hypothetical protein PPYR_05321 [Photinus pyralis]
MNSFTQANMYRLLVFASFVTVSIAGVVRVPKIYNALISSDENLSPSHAIPVVEPVLRTTALGVAFPPIYVHPPHNVLLQTTSETDQKDTKSEPRRNETETIEDKRGDKKPSIPQLTYHGSLYPLAIDSYFPYSYSSELLFPALPYYQQPIFGDLGHINNGNTEKKVEIPYPTNIKKNPEIPDVPPPPLPGKEKPRNS